MRNGLRFGVPSILSRTPSWLVMCNQQRRKRQGAVRKRAMRWHNTKGVGLVAMLCVLMQITPRCVLAQEGDAVAERISLEALVAHARAHNPEIQAAEQRYRAAQAR